MTKLPLLLLTILFTACAADPSLDVTEQQLGGATDCSVPGALPDDGVDDRPAIQAALDTKGCALLGPGIYDLETPVPRLAGDMRYSMLRMRGSASLRGTGPSTVLRFRGNAALNDWYGVAMIGPDNEVTSLTLDGTDLTNTEEQTHLIQILGPAPRQRISGVWFNHPAHLPNKCGDCIKIVGYDVNNQRVSADITGNIFAQCHRSGIAVHSGVDDLAVTSNLFLATGDQDIDFEGSGGAIDNVTISGNVMRRTLNSGVSVALGATLTRRATFSNNVLHGGHFNSYNVDRLTLTGNLIEAPGMALEMIKTSKESTISGNVLVQTSTTGTLAQVVVRHHNEGKPGALTFTGNTHRIVSTNGTAFNVQSATDVVVSNSIFLWDAPAGASAAAATMIIYGITQPTESVVVSGNTIRGPWKWALVTTNSYEATHGGGARAITFAGNIMRGVQFGWACNVPGPGPLVSLGNSGATNQCSGTITAGN